MTESLDVIGFQLNGSNILKGMIMKIQDVFYGMYGHIYRLAEAVAEGLDGRMR